MSDQLNLHVVQVSTRPGREGPAVSEWFVGQARAHARFAIEVIDLAEVALPMFDETRHPRFGNYEHEHTKAWATIVARADAFVFVTPEYDFSTPAVLVNALQYLVREWAYKPVGFVSYGGVSGGLRGVQMTKLLVTALRMMPMVEGVAIPFFPQYLDEATHVFDPGETQAKASVAMLDELHRWAGALKPLRGA